MKISIGHITLFARINSVHLSMGLKHVYGLLPNLQVGRDGNHKYSLGIFVLHLQVIAVAINFDFSL